MYTPENIAQQYTLKCKELEEEVYALKQSLDKKLRKLKEYEEGSYEISGQIEEHERDRIYKDKRIAELEKELKSQKSFLRFENQKSSLIISHNESAIEALKREVKEKDTLLEQNAAEIQRLMEANERLAAHNTDMEIECRRVLRESQQVEPETERVEVELYFASEGGDRIWLHLDGTKVSTDVEIIPTYFESLQFAWDKPKERIALKGYYLKPKQS